ncbi:MAG: citrate synthase [Ruminococcaceae bacterium]|nr:citrate synthase [Oscillospiraceae bacterium]
MANYVSPISESAIQSLCGQLENKNKIELLDYWKYGVKRGLRNADGTGVMAGLTKICSVEGYYIDDGEKVPKDGVLKYRGYNINELISACDREDRFGYEEIAWLLLFGSLPTESQLQNFKDLLAECRHLPDDFVDDMIMKNPSKNIMNKMARCVLALYSLDENPDDLSIENVLKQSIHLIAQLPVIMCYAYQIKRRIFYGKSMYLHPLKAEYGTAQTILRSIRSDRQFTAEEAKLLDTCLMIQAEHGGGNNSTFATRVLTSSGTDSYSAIAAAIGSLKGPKHGGANIKVREMFQYLYKDVSDITDEGQVADFLTRIIRKQAGDGSGLIYGMGHAVYTASDPRAVILKEKARVYAEKTGFSDQFRSIELVEQLTPEIFKSVKGENKRICANVDLYSGLIYEMLGIPEDLYTPLFATARIAGWSAHRIEEIMTGKIIRPAYKNVSLPRKYVAIADREEDNAEELYVPSEERF